MTPKSKQEANLKLNHEPNQEATLKLTPEASQAPNRESCVPDAPTNDLWPQFDAYIKSIIAESAKQYAMQHKLNAIIQHWETQAE